MRQPPAKAGAEKSVSPATASEMKEVRFMGPLLPLARWPGQGALHRSRTALRDGTPGGRSRLAADSQVEARSIQGGGGTARKPHMRRSLANACTHEVRWRSR